MQGPGSEHVVSDLPSALDTLRLGSGSPSLHEAAPVTSNHLPPPEDNANPWADEQPKLHLKPAHTPDFSSIAEAAPSIFDSSVTHVEADVNTPKDVLREFDPLTNREEAEARQAWAAAEGHPPPPRPPSSSDMRSGSGSGAGTHSRSGSLGGNGTPSRPSTPSHAPSSSFPSLAAFARTFSIPSVTKSRARPLSVDTAKPILSPSPSMAVSFAVQQQATQSATSSPLAKQLPLPPDNTDNGQSAPITRIGTPSGSAGGGSGSGGSESPRRDKDLSFDFQKFLDQMKSKGAEPVAKYLRSFLSNFAKRTFTVNDQVKVINDFLTFIAARMRESDIWRNASDVEFDNAMEGMEKLVMNRLYEFTFTPCLPTLNPPRPVTADDLERDRILAQRINLFKWVKPSHLDISELETEDAATMGFLDFAQQELCKVNHYKAPRDKLICILNCCKVIFGLLRHLKHDEGADSFVPVLIFVVLKADAEHLLSNVEFVNRFRNSAKLQSEAGYYLSSLMGAVQFIETMDHTSLSNITQEEFERNVEAAIQSLPPSTPSSPTSSTSSFAPSVKLPYTSPHAGEESAQPLTLSVPSQTQAQSIGDDARRLLQKTGDAVSKPLGAISRIFSEALDEKMAYLPGPFAPLELGRERAQENARIRDEKHWAHPDQVAQHKVNAPGGSGAALQAPIQTPYQPRIRRPSPAPPSPVRTSLISEDTPSRTPPGPAGMPYTHQALALGPSQDVRSMSPSRPINAIPHHLQPPSQAQHISRTPTPSLDLAAVQAEIDRAHASASAASRATLAQIFPSVEPQVRELVLEANGGDLGKSIESLLEMSSTS